MTFPEFLEIGLTNVVTFFKMSAKITSLGFVKTKIFWSKGYDVIFSVFGVTSKILLLDSTFTVNMIMWPKFDCCNITMREVIITSTLQRFEKKNRFFKRFSWFKCNNFGLTIGMVLKFYISVEKGLKLRARRFWG